MDFVTITVTYLQSIFSSSNLAYITAVGGALTVLLAFFKRVRRFMNNSFISPVRNFFSSFETLNKKVADLEIRTNEDILSRLQKLEEIHTDIKKELTHNGGSSMKDIITALNDKVSHICDNSSYLANQFSRLEALQKSIVNTSDRPTFETDVSGSCIFANKAFLNLIGRSFDDVKNFGWINIVHPDDRHFVKKEWDAALEDNRNFELIFRIICKEKNIYRVYCEAHPINGPLNGYIGHYEGIEKIGKYTT
jgi:PAS domain S-box-containing protein